MNYSETATTEPVAQGQQCPAQAQSQPVGSITPDTASDTSPRPTLADWITRNLPAQMLERRERWQAIVNRENKS